MGILKIHIRIENATLEQNSKAQTSTHTTSTFAAFMGNNLIKIQFTYTEAFHQSNLNYMVHTEHDRQKSISSKNATSCSNQFV